MIAEICRKCGEEKTYERVGDIEYYACYECVRAGKRKPKTDRELIVNLAVEVSALRLKLHEVERQTNANEADILTTYEEFTEFRLSSSSRENPAELRFRGGCV